MRYWLIFNSKQAGPFTSEQMSEVDFNASTPVWYEGLPDWIQAGDVEELRAIIERREVARMNHYRQREQAAASQGARQSTESSTANVGQRRQQSAQASSNYSAMTATDERPSNYLVWAILTTLFCNIIMGVIAIIYASKVNSLFERGDIDGARRNSERAQWFIIFAIVIGVIWSPFQVALAML